MTDDGLNGILPAVKYRVPTKHLRTSGSTAVFVALPQGFDQRVEPVVSSGFGYDAQLAGDLPPHSRIPSCGISAVLTEEGIQSRLPVNQPGAALLNDGTRLT